MNGRKASAALTALPEDMVAEAMEPGQRGRGFSWLRLAVCAVIVLGLFVGFWPTQPEIVTAPGLLTVTVYAMDGSNDSMVISEYIGDVVEFPYGFSYHPAVSCFPGIPIELKLEQNIDIVFEVNLDEGSFLVEERYYEQMPLQFCVPNNVCLYWRPFYVVSTVEHGDYASISVKEDIAYADILIIHEEYIVGFAVLAFERQYGREFDVRLIESVCYPQVNGEYQNITVEYVRQQIEEVKTRTHNVDE